MWCKESTATRVPLLIRPWGPEGIEANVSDQGYMVMSQPASAVWWMLIMDVLIMRSEISFWSFSHLVGAFLLCRFFFCIDISPWKRRKKIPNFHVNVFANRMCRWGFWKVTDVSSLCAFRTRSAERCWGADEQNQNAILSGSLTLHPKPQYAPFFWSHTK